MATAYFFKYDTTQIIVGSRPVKVEDYITFEVDDAADLSNASLQMVNNNWYLTTLPPSPNHVFNGEGWVICEDKLSALIDIQRQQVRDDINTLRDKKINGGVYVPAIDKWIDSDARAERNLLSTKASFDLFGDELDITWTCADNTTIKLTKEIMLHIWQALLNNKQTNHANAFLHKNAVDQSETPLEYDFSGGWTQTYEDVVAQSTEVVNG